MPPITGHSVLVIGGSSGIGAGVAKLAAEAGLIVSIASSNPIRVADAIKAIKTSVPSAQIKGFTIDLSKSSIEADLQKLLTDVTTATGTKLDHIIYTANTLDMRPISAVDVEYLKESGQFGLVVPMLLAKLAPKFLNESYKSSITFTSGRVADRPVPGYTIGSAWANTLHGMARALAIDLAPLRVNVVSPGATDTEMWGSGEQREMRREMFSKGALLGKVGSAEEVGEAYIYLMKDSNNTGSVINTSGGSLLQ